MTREPIHTAAIIAILILGIICEALGIDMLYKQTPLFEIASVKYPAAPVLLIIGLILIVIALTRFSKSNTAQTPARPWLAQNWLTLLGILIAIVLLGVFIRLNYQPGTGTADKYDLLVNLILIIIGITAAVGYGIFKWIWRNIRDRVDRIAEADRNFTTAEVQTSLGFAWWLHFVDEKKGQKHMSDGRSMVYLSRAIKNAERALRQGNKLDEAEYEEIICYCKSNLAYYLTERHRIEKHPEDKERCLELALYAYQVAQEKRALQYFRPYQWEETYAWVLWHFAKDDKTKQKAQTIKDGLLERTDTPDAWSTAIDKKWKDLET